MIFCEDPLPNIERELILGIGRGRERVQGFVGRQVVQKQASIAHLVTDDKFPDPDGWKFEMSRPGRSV